MSPDVLGAPSLESMIRAGAAMLQGSSSPLLDARVLAKHVLEVDDASLIARAADPVANNAASAYDELIMRRAGGEPVAYITGVKEFWGLPFRVTPDVLIPRGDSECLIEAVIARRARNEEFRMLDLGTGSGCLLCALLSEFKSAAGLGVDASPSAVAIAEENAGALSLRPRAQFAVSDWFENVNGRFDIVIANAPYIPEGDRAGLIVDVSDYEPASALFAGKDGLDAYRNILKGLPAALAPGALVVFEYGDPEQGAALRALIAAAAPGANISVIRDLAARERGVVVDFA